MSSSSISKCFPELVNISPLLASGGQKEVYRAKLNSQQVVLKIIRPSPNAQARTEREIAAVRAVNSDYVATVYQSGQRLVNGDNRYFIVEQFIDGTTYREQLYREPVQSLAKTMEIGLSLHKAVLDFERAGLVHRDLKPENIMIDKNNKLWIIDFGLVRFLNLESLTQTAQMFGPCTFGYGAPEQIRNVKTLINSRADLFSIGVILYEALRGHNPYVHGARDALEVLRRVERSDLPPLNIAEDRNGALSDYLLSLTSRFPSRRPQRAVDALDCFTPIYNELRSRN